MKKPNPPHRHHYIPTSYLERWAGPDGRVCQFSGPYRNVVVPTRRHPEATGFLERGYELQKFEPELA
jgi:hypothetical protein